MLRLRNSLTVCLLCALIFLSCGFVDLRPIGIGIEPNDMNSLLPDSFSPLIIKFDTEVIKNEAEGIMQINSDYGSVRGDKFWRNNDLYFVPLQGWTAGVRHTLNLSGTIRSIDGREIRIDRFIPFYAINRNAHPFLAAHYPEPGESVGTNNFIFEFQFSLSMDKLSVETALALDGIGNKTFEWSDNDRLLKVIIDNPLTPWSLYRWSIKDTAKSADGVPLPKTYSGHFTTDLDRTLPSVTGVYPAIFSDGEWFATGANIENGLGGGMGIIISFNKPMGENAARSIRFEPSLSGRAEFLSVDKIVYVFTRDPEPEISYTLTILGEAKDSEGLKIGSDSYYYFTPDIPYLSVLHFKTDDDSVIDDFSQTNTVLPAKVNIQTGELEFSVYFSLPFGYEEKVNAAQKITLAPFFPKHLLPIALNYVHWASDDRLIMRWEGLSFGTENNHFYKLVIPGGKNGIGSGAGIFMKENIVLYLEAIP
ncbi:MAG: hypothetical protein FWC01_01075 [Treponema sp.]|nr:hypothetical protein [Treponema sp.]MCL2236796.1 hypothetical protein [Treponema sp.]